ncbi:hypothetical protein E4U40_001438 [Claviceps sp. LM458 group G5]|nr:hypothetical protein E4U40_001438 [Claviceps sp. LM458 group G5]
MLVAQDPDKNKHQPPHFINEPDNQQHQHTPSQTPWQNWSSGDEKDGSSDASPNTPKISLQPSHVPAALRPGGLSEPWNLEDQDDNVWNEARRQPSDEKDAGGLQQFPDALRPGGNRSATNPFLKRKPVPQASGALVTDAFSKLDINNTASSINPWQEVSETKSDSDRLPSPPPPPPPRPVTAEAIESDAWAISDKPPLSQPPSRPVKSPVLPSPSPDDDVLSPWKEEDTRPFDDKGKGTAGVPSTAMSDELLQEQNVWDDLGSIDTDKGKVPRLSVVDAATSIQPARIDEWSLIDADARSNSPKISHMDMDSAHDSKPPLPARPKSVQQRWVPSRQPVDAKAETYHIKNIQWHDQNSDKNPRISPILIQNQNGPCPLVALVNALTMTTPADIPETTLVEILRPREQISLDLLLRAVFDELMSPRRTSPDKTLPDVSDLYAFLQSLHNGMNVNPRFVPTPEMVNAYKRTSLTHLHPTERGSLIPGTFENTTEMNLYATFSIPLIHGWLPAQSDPVYDVLERQAASYEDAQNLLFSEEGLTDKLSSDEGLTEDEQQLYQDIMTIKMFLDSSATQLTAWGIEVIGKAMRPGTFAIFFRNDHFSTLYCHPQTLQLLSLVTDAGYLKHDQVVWETLVDVNGEHTEFLSGDFRVVDSSKEAAPRKDLVGSPPADGGNGRDWTTVQNKGGKNRQQHVANAVALSPLEQEDRDLALALQLQEEEDQRHREEQSRRQRESALSEQFIEQQGRRPTRVNRDRRHTSETTGVAAAAAAAAAERRSSNSHAAPPVTTPGTTQPRQASIPQQQQQHVIGLPVPPRRPGVSRSAEAESNGRDVPPPSYEQAAQDPAYVPPTGHANASTRNAVAGGPGPSNVLGGMSSFGQPFRRQAAGAGGTGGGRERDCVVM